ncbi:MAG: GNAT family N-acetyltransferase [Chloroflexota bacterium]|nr:GNAT family N-acetyltransferase [Chloroflexota bacterium]
MSCEGPVHLRRATTEDAAGIAQVHADGWQRVHEGLVPPEYLACRDSLGREDFWREELEVEAPDRKPWVAMLDERIIGFASGGIARDEDADRGTGEIYLLFVTPECWEKGIRTNLIEHVVRDLQEHEFERAIFWVLAADTTMRAFAEFVGWSTDGTNRFEDCGGTQVEELRYTHLLREANQLR